MLVAGLDLARRSDHSALVLLDVEPDRLTVSAALRLPQAPLREQFTLIAPHLAGLDLLVFDQSGLGDAAAELLPKTPPHVGVCLIAGDRPLSHSASSNRLVVGKSCLIQRLGTAMRSRALTVAERAPGRDLFRKELAQFVFKPGAQGRLRLEAARGHDDLVIAAALAVLAADLANVSGRRDPAVCARRHQRVSCDLPARGLRERLYGARPNIAPAPSCRMSGPRPHRRSPPGRPWS
jgi:hypothetical protein